VFVIADADADVEGLASANRAVLTHLEAAIVDRDPAALAFLLEGLITLARFVGDNPVRLLGAIDVLSDEDNLDGNAVAGHPACQGRCQPRRSCPATCRPRVHVSTLK
jgi:hypothetical protein